MASRRVRLSDVARAAHVSVSTASTALSGKAGVSEGTRRRVQAAARELGYRTHVGAQALRRGSHIQIAVLLDPLIREGAAVASGSYVGRLVNGIADAATSRGAHVTLVSPGQAPPGADVWIVLETGSHLSAPADRGFGVPFICGGVEWPGWDLGSAATLTYPFARIMHTVMTDLVARGARRPGICCPTGDATWLRELRAAYEDWCAHAGIEPVVTWYEAAPDSATAAGGDVIRRGADAVFHISNRLQPQVVAGARAEAPVAPLVVVGEGINEAAFNPRVGVLSLAPDETSDTLVATALASIASDPPPTPQQLQLPWRYLPSAPTRSGPVLG